MAIIDLFPDAEGLEGEIMEYPLARDGYASCIVHVSIHQYNECMVEAAIR